MARRRLLKHDTIYALSSGEGRAGVAIIRVSGPRANDCLIQMCKRSRLPTERRATRRFLFDAQTKEKLDDALVLRFPGPNSFTGEDIVEFHVHGSRSVITGVMDSLSTIETCRPAEAGEFTQRAFENNRMDLLQVEGLADLLNAETEAQRRQAIRQMSGDVATVYEEWRSTLLSCAAHVEALIDFGDDELDVMEAASYSQVVQKVKRLKMSIESFLHDGHRGEIVRSGVKVSILGAPNAGKSSLLNLLVKRPAAIVSNIPGTTRDIVQVPINIAGYPVVFSDTAGIRHSDDAIEKEGIVRAHRSNEEANIRVIVVDIEDVETIDPNVAGLIEQDRVIIVLNKCDTVSPAAVDTARDQLHARFPSLNKNSVLPMCCQADSLSFGMDEFLNLLTSQVNEILRRDGSDESGALITRARHRTHLSQCIVQLDEFITYESSEVDFAAEALRVAVNEIGSILGRIDIEEIFDVLFKDFCIGK